MTAATLPRPSVHPGYGVPVERTWQLGRRRYRVVPPRISDPRIHLSSVILTIHLLGQVWLGFGVSIAQIGVTLLTCAALEIIWTYRRTSVLAWPASALLTGTGISLVLRVIGTENGDYWSFRGWYVFVSVAVFSLLTKYLIRFRGTHVFNPSNVGLVVAFLVLGAGRVEPLDYWWAPLGGAMVAAYAVIFLGGLSISGRLGLLGLGAAFWTTLAMGTGVLAARGHCITARWSFSPVCGEHFWWIIVTSPEVMIFLFFMITDPRTVPAGRVARVAFGAVLGVVCTVLLAPWETEFGAKVGLLAGLVIMCAARPAFDRLFPAAGSVDDRLGRYVARIAMGDRPVHGRLLARAVAVIAVLGVAGAGVAAAGAPNLGHDRSVDAPAALVTDVQPVDPASLPPVTFDPTVAGLSASLATPDGAQELAATLAWNLQVEAEAMATGNAGLLPTVADGQRLLDLEAALEAGRRVVSFYTFDTLHLIVVFPGGLQRGPNAGLVAEGIVEEVSVSDAGVELGRQRRPFETTFSLRQTTSGRWLNSDTLPPGES